jgi:hypothetical protein
MRGWVIILIVLGVWIAYQRDHTFSAITSKISAPRKRRGSGVISPRQRGYGATSIGGSGYTSPGSGQPFVQPALNSSFGIGNSGLGPGVVGVSTLEG